MQLNSIVINEKGIGPVLIENSKRAKSISVSVKPNLEVRVAVPHGVHFDRAVEFIRLKKPWIVKHLGMMKRRDAERSALADLSAKIDKAKAGRQLVDRLAQLANAHGFTFNKVSIRCQKTRWGSCSQKNNISLNVKLMLLPEDLIDYVILHELMHTKIHDHSRRFLRELDKYVVDGKALATRLRKYGYSLP